MKNQNTLDDFLTDEAQDDFETWMSEYNYRIKYGVA